MMKTVLSFLFLALSWGAVCQVPFKWDIDGALGITSYQGDLDAFRVNAGFREIKYAASLSLRRNISNYYALRFNLLAGKLAGDDRNFAEPEWRIRRAISFQSTVVEFTFLNEVYPLGMYPVKGKPSKTRNAFAPYLLAGIGWANSNPKVDWNDKNGNDEIDPAKAALDKQAKLNRLNIVIPIGFGVRFRLKDHSTFKLEGALRPTFSDYLDGVSLAGNPDENDWYFTAQIGVTYPFGKNRAKAIAKTNEKEKEKVAKVKEKKEADTAEKDKKETNTAEKDKKAKDSKEKEMKDVASDIDKDGTPDADDECLATPGLRSLKGCPDTDKDGVADPHDDCPDVPGLKTLSGCPDKDNDGVADNSDKCPDVAGAKNLSGCPDKDGDGIADDDDECPDTPGTASSRGCPASDRDQDGIADADDRCPDFAGPAGAKGCPDTDKDGIVDIDDKCPGVAGKASQKGCPDMPPPDKAIYFGVSKNDWFRTSDETMDEVLAVLKNDPSLHATISGHTDESTEGSLSGLSDVRANKVYDYLVSQGISADRLEFSGFGSSRPIGEKSKSDDPQLNRQLNRRVEVRFFRQ